MQQERFHIGLGMFVIGALFIIGVAAVVLYNQYLQGKIETYVMFFKGSLNGLETGSPIMYRGVKIGRVSRIELTVDKSNKNVAIPVYVAFYVEKSFAQRNNPLKVLIASGIVAKIVPPTLFTTRGTIKLSGIDSHYPVFYSPSPYHGFARFPTQSTVEEAINFDHSLKSIEKTFKEISDFFHSQNVTTLVNSFAKLAKKIESFSADQSFKEIADFFQSNHLKTFLTTFTTMSKQVGIFAADVNLQLPSTIANFNESMKNFSKAADSTRNLTDYLARHPEALLRGKS